MLPRYFRVYFCKFLAEAAARRKKNEQGRLSRQRSAHVLRYADCCWPAVVVEVDDLYACACLEAQLGRFSHFVRIGSSIIYYTASLYWRLLVDFLTGQKGRCPR